MAVSCGVYSNAGDRPVVTPDFSKSTSMNSVDELSTRQRRAVENFRGADNEGEDQRRPEPGNHEVQNPDNSEQSRDIHVYQGV